MCRLRHLVGIEEINSSRNGLMLFRPIEWSFDNSRAIFMRDTMGNWSFTMIDESLHEVQLTDKFVELQNASKDQKKGVEVSIYWVQYNDFVTCV